MANRMQMEWTGVRKSRFEAVRKSAGWETDTPWPFTP
jgi:hypothetical protein